MSHNYPYRRPPSDTDLRPDPGPYSSADRRHPSNDFYRPQESFSYPSSSSSSSSSSSRAAPQLPVLQDGVLSILSSCGLEPNDLALLAELPEDVLTVESLPHILKQIKGKRGTVKPFPPSAPSSSSSSSSSYPAGSTRQPTVSTDWDQLRSQPVQYPLDLIKSTSLPSKQEHWGTSRTRRADPSPSSSSSSSGFTMDYNHRPGPSDYGKTGPVPSQDRPAFSPTDQGNRARPSRYSEARPTDSRAAPSPKPRPQEGRCESGSSSSRSIRPLVSMPFKKQALDFHGTTPPVYPYSCSLCHITVLSERVWIQHINGTLHADGQLSLLQQFPNWDCRMETVLREDDQSEKWRDDKKPSPPRQTSNQNQTSAADQKLQKTSDKGKVVCVKFPAQSVDETYLRKLTEPFGKILKILMFPSLAFLELGTVDQAKDLVKFHVNYPPTVNGERIEFSISNTFSFLQSCQVLSFSPAPAGDDGQSDLLSIVKRFGPPLYTLFLPSMAFVEMKNVSDAQKLVDYYSSNTLRINDDCIKVSFSGEYKSLMRVPSAKKYEEEPRSAKRARSSSREKNEKSGTKRTRSESSRDRKTRSRSRDKRTRTKSRSRDKSTEKSSRHRKTRSRSRSRSRSRDQSSSRSSRKNRSRSRDKSSRNRRTRTRSRSRDKSRTKSSRQTRSRSREKSTREKKSRSKSREKTSTEKPTETGSESRSRDKSSTGPSGEKMVERESKSEDEPASLGDSKPEAAETEQTEEEAEVSAEESDIEGMEVIAEDGEDLEDQEVESQEEEEDEENDSPAERTQSSEQGEEEEEEEDSCGMKKEEEESEETAQTREDEQEPDFPVDLENCITLDELDEDKSDKDDGVPDESESRQPSRVLYFLNLPPHFTDSEFIRLVRGFGTAVCYIFIRNRHEGFIEMSSSSEASKAARELKYRPVIFNNVKTIVHLSYKYRRLTNGKPVPLDEGKEERSDRRSPSSRRSKSRTSDRDEADKRLKEKKESLKKSPEKESKKTPEKDLASTKTTEEHSTSKETSEKEPTSRKTPENDLTSRKTPEKDSLGKQTEEKDLENTAENVGAARNTPEEKTNPEDETLRREETPEDDSVSQKTLKTESSKDDLEIKEKPAEDQLEENPSETDQPRDEEEKTPEVCLESKTSESEVKHSESPHPPDGTGDHPKPQPEQGGEAAAETERQSEPAAEKPGKPVGTEFVRPVVGYFCNLCQLIFADEDEAKQQHCSSPTHYSRYQEKTGKDPWTS